MELLDRYLQAVRKHLPWQRQDDIIAELAPILSRNSKTKKPSLAGRSPKQKPKSGSSRSGSPIQVAARYQRAAVLDRAALFPTYWYVLKLVFFGQRRFMSLPG